MAVEWTKNLNVAGHVAGVSVALNEGMVTLDVSSLNRLTYSDVVELRDALSELLEMMSVPVEPATSDQVMAYEPITLVRLP